MVAVLDKMAVGLEDIDAYMAELMRATPPLSYRDAAIATVDWLLSTERFMEIAPTLVVTGLMHRAQRTVHGTHRGLTNWPGYKTAPVVEESAPPQTHVSSLEMVIAADLERPMVGCWSDMEFVVSKRRMRLAEMTRFDCLEKAAFYAKAAQSSQAHRQFLQAIAGRLEGQQTVAEVLADSDLQGLWKHAEGSARTMG